MSESNVNSKSTSVYIYPFNFSSQVYEIAKTLRENGINTIIEYQNIKLKKALPWAEKNGINNVLIIGEDELENNVVTYKNLAKSSQETLPLSNLINLLK